MGNKNKEKRGKKDKKDKKKHSAAKGSKDPPPTAAAAKKQDRLTKRELRRRKNLKHENEWKQELEKFSIQLNAFGLKIKTVKGDGNCLFRTVADQVEGDENKHLEYREKIVAFIVANKEYFQPFVEDDETFEDYVADMRKDAVWGGNLELQAFSMLYQRNVVVHILGQPAYVISQSPELKTVHCSYHLGEHYNSVRWEDDINDNIPRDLPLHLVPKQEPSKVPVVAKQEEDKKEVTRDVIAKEEIISFAMTITGIMDYEVISEALNRTFYGKVPTEKMVHKECQKILDEADKVEEEKIRLISEPVPVAPKVVEEEKVPPKKNGKSHIQYVLNAKGEKIIAPGPNKKCHCGSNERYKKCCMNADQDRTVAAEQKTENTKKAELIQKTAALYI